MKLFNKITYLLLALSFFATSCSNDDDKKTIEPEKIEPVCLITSYTNQWFMKERSSNIVSNNFVYDAKGRIIVAPEGSNQISFEYYDNQIIVKYANPEPNIVIDYYTLDKSKKITHLVRKAMNTYRGDTEVKDYVILDFEYDSQNQLVAIKEDGKKATFTYLNGNLTEMHDDLKDENTTYKFTYNLEEEYQALPLFSLSPIYHLNSLHRIPTPANNPIGMAVLTASGYFGKLPKNKITSIGTYAFSYSKNKSNQTISVIEKNSIEEIDSTAYQFKYLCK